MLGFMKTPWRTAAVTGLFAVFAATALLPATSALAQNRTLPDFTDLVEQVSPSVVNIRTSEKAKTAAAGGGIDEQMLEFFRRFGIPVPPNMPRGPRSDRAPAPQEEAQPRGVGSGFILTPDGFIMTNAHVVEGADEVIVTLTDNREYKAKIVGSDKRTDVAVVKIEATGLPAVKIGDSSRLKVGEWVMAIGSPFGLENTVTAGIVSARGRDIGAGPYDDYLQIDAPVNKGNSGGPTFNLAGEVVGVNTAIASPSGGSVGIAFAIPAETTANVVASLKESGAVARGFLGVQIQPLTPEMADAIGLKEPKGALVASLEVNGPAEKAGLRRGDTIIALDGAAVKDARDLTRKVGQRRPGAKAELTLWRDGKEQKLPVQLGKQPQA